ncbi:Protein N-acetyltransferase, RimJ/RimL family [Clostridium cavendishii DSM 21758]|uniref:Protein N-acetyltransferase, RimJ/RimL family n=1 Tax=Clostridium cavendishii DSM 21758 TaxID=1121302 RepID=A0A1M6NK52_9CLOT|nr:GNAT family protein [Clostridium cavendishii]SHJ96125.1 Protein N-acetyltransferase, RimJ/RimL family [Clostridium cavendishii DSM 21758]
MRILETDRLVLRRFSPDDWKDLHEYLSNELVVKYEPYGIYDEESSKKEALYRSKEECFFAVCLKENDKLIGNVYFNIKDPKEFLTWEIGYVFNPKYSKRGYATEACKRILDYGFEELNACRIVAMCNPKNINSWRVLERLKMRREGHLVKNIFFKYDEKGKPIWHDTYEYAILKNEWNK